MVKPGVTLAKADTLDYENHSVSADVARKYRKTTAGTWERRPRVDSGFSDTSSGTLLDPDASIADSIRAMVESSVADELEITEGEYYCAPAMPRGTPAYSAMFPDGHESVLRLMIHDVSRGVQFGLAPRNRWVAVQALLRRFNALSCELNGAFGASRDVGVLSKGRDPVAVRDWVSNFMARMGEIQSEIRNLIDCLDRIARRFCQLDVIPREVMAAQEGSFVEYFVSGLRRLPERVDKLAEVHATFRDALVSDVGEATESVGRLHISHDVGAVAGRGGALDTVPMPRVGRGMRAIRVHEQVKHSSNALRIGKWIAMT